MDFSLGSKSARKPLHSPAIDSNEDRLFIAGYKIDEKGIMRPPPTTVTSSGAQTKQTQETSFPSFGPESILPKCTKPRANLNANNQSTGIIQSSSSLINDVPPPSSLYDIDFAAPDHRYMNFTHNHSTNAYQYDSNAPNMMSPAFSASKFKPGVNGALSSPSKRNNEFPGALDSTLETPRGPSDSAYAATSTSSSQCWVVVFGYPAGAMSTVVNIFKGIGTIVNYEEGRGNWVNIEFASNWAAQKALSKNGMLLPGTACMIGVIPFSQSSSQPASFLSPIKAPALSQITEKAPIKPLFAQPANRPVVHHSTIPRSTIHSDPIYASEASRSNPSFSSRFFRFIFGW